MDDLFMKFLEKYNKEILDFGIALNISIPQVSDLDFEVEFIV